MAATDLFISSPIDGVELFKFPTTYGPYSVKLNYRLPIGKQIEEQLLASLQKDARYDVLAYGLQVIAEGITIGELDFIIRDHKEEITFHLELVHKFYINDSAQGLVEMEQWIGPNYKDKLSYKLEKLRGHQFPLLYKSATRPYLDALGLDPMEMTQKLCFKAELYVPEQMKLSALSQCYANAIQGNYISYETFKHCLNPNAAYHVCEKQNWIQDERSCTEWYDADTCRSHLMDLAADGRAVMLWTKENGNHSRSVILYK